MSRDIDNIKLWGNKKFTCSDDENLFCKPEDLIKLVSGGEVKLSALFINNEYDELEKNSITLSDKEFEQVLDQLCGNIDEEQYELILKAKAVYDWALLADILKDHNYISEVKVAVHDKHKNDLEFLKYFVKKYTPEKYYEIFKEASDKKNYVSYSYNTSSLKNGLSNKFEKATQEKFCKYIKGIVSKIKVSDEDKERYDEMLADLENVSFCPKQVTGDNRVIPYQLYWIELKTILDKAEMFFPFLKQKDEYCTVSEKILSLMEFRVPYYVGPLVSKDKSQFAWMVKKADAPSEKIYPWNFDKIVDKDESEEAFINRMTCKCTYCAGEDVLPKCSLLYSEFTVLNTINSIKINDVPITTECKQAIFTECFEKFRRVTKKKITEMLIANGYMTKKDEISGIDDTIGASLSSYHDFKRLIENNVITKADAENIIKRITFAQDRNRLKKWLRGNYNFSDADLNYVAGLKYKDFGRLSEKLLTGYRDIVDGEERNPSIIEMLRNTNENLMQLLSDKYTYSEQIESDNRAYYAEHPLSLNKRLDEMYIPNAVKRPIIRTLDIVKEVCSLMGGQPEKIFVEMARGATEEQKNKRTKSRREQITEWYNGFEESEVKELRELLDSKTDAELQSERLYLYFMQLGRCMYSGEHIPISMVGSDTYDVDHIHPQSKKKDDSLSNKVLVLSTINKAKSDTYPLNRVNGYDIQNKMMSFWTMLFDKNLITKVKYDRLVRKTDFTDDELAGFINRQLVETRQSTKAVAELLKDLVADSEIVYVKAGLASEFRHEYDFIKCRNVNDYHHAKDAYLNIVMGNVYNVKFTKNPMNFIKSGEKYTLKIKPALDHNISRNGVTAWDKEKSMEIVRKTMDKNNIRYVRYSYFSKSGNGCGLFKEQPLRKGHGQVNRKKELDIEKYGGYNSATVSYFYLVKYTKKKKKVIALVPIVLHRAANLKTDEAVLNYMTDELELNDPQLLLNGRKIKINTLFEIDGFRGHLSSKTGNQVILKSAMQLIVGTEWEKYIKRLAKFKEKHDEAEKMKKAEYKITKFNDIDKERNQELYELLKGKLKNTAYSVFMETPIETLEKGEEAFKQLSVEKQSIALLHIVELFCCTNPSGKDLTLIGGVKNAGIIRMTMSLNAKRFSKIHIIDQSPTGLIEHKSEENLLKL